VDRGAVARSDLAIPVLTDEKSLLLHGSSNPNIQEFEPKTPSAKDDDAFSQQTAVFASSDGIWPMFYAILDRSFKLRMLNSALRFEIGPDTLSDVHYFFSITDAVLKENPWREGVIYVLPRDGFALQPPYTVTGWRVHDPHWASLQPVQPLARIRVRPEDFPLLAQVHGHEEAVVVARAARDPEGFPWLDE
jgi:hypothetical protein